METAPYFQEIAEGPETGAAFWVTTEDGMRLRVGAWRHNGSTKGTILIFPGRTEYVEIYGRTARGFVDNGYSLLTLDWRGHGLSDRIIADRNTLHVNRFSDYQLDVAALIEAATELRMPKPWFLLGNSMGGCIGLRALCNGLPVSACAFTAPMWGLEMTALQRIVARPVSWTANAIGKGHLYVPGHDGKNYALHNPFDGNRMTYDADQYGYWVNQARSKPCLQTAGSSMRWLNQSLLECDRLAKLPSPDVPCIAFCGDHDGLVDIDAIRDRLAGWHKGRFEQISGAKHALLLEIPEVRMTVIAKIAKHFDDVSEG